MKNINSIYVIAALHGNEMFGLKILALLDEADDKRITTRIGNLEALSKNKRFLESDLNRSFGATTADTKETRLAQRILADIRKINPDLIIDIHTSKAAVGRVGILAINSPFLVRVAENLSMEHVAIMSKSITNQSLLGQFPKQSLSLEFGVKLRSDKLASNIAGKIKALLEPKHEVINDTTLPIYRVLRIVPKTEAVGIEFRNYELNHRLGGYPFLMGDNNYKDHAGFIAEKLT